MDFLALRENMGRKKEKPAVRWNCKPRKELTGGRPCSAEENQIKKATRKRRPKTKLAGEPDLRAVKKNSRAGICGR
jgi:hypothetical protein